MQFMANNHFNQCIAAVRLGFTIAFAFVALDDALFADLVCSFCDVFKYSK